MKNTRILGSDKNAIHQRYGKLNIIHGGMLWVIFVHRLYWISQKQQCQYIYRHGS